MLADPKTMRTTALLDLELINVMPAQHACDVPWWLILGQPGIMISDGKQEFLDLFESRKDQFIRAMERVEDASPPSAGQPRLSARMRDSWSSGRFLVQSRRAEQLRRRRNLLEVSAQGRPRRGHVRRGDTCREGRVSCKARRISSTRIGKRREKTSALADPFLLRRLLGG